MLAENRDESHVDAAVASINQALDAESELPQKLHAFPALQILETEEAIGELKELVEAHLRARLFQRGEIPLAQHLDEILDALAGPVILTTDALRRFFHVAARKLLPMLEAFAHGQQRRLLLAREEERLSICIPEAIEQLKTLWKRFRVKNVCLKDFLDSPRGAEIFLRCLEREVECQTDARILLQMHYLGGCTAQELAEYFGIRRVSAVKQTLRAARKKLWRKAIELASKEPGFNSSWSI